MINHARTLLLNISAKTNRNEIPGYEYIPPNFVPIDLPQTLNTVHKLLFGANPDNYFANLRALELLRYIHSTDLESYLYRFDSRITYAAPNSGELFANFDVAPKIVVKKNSPLLLNVVGQFIADNKLGHGQREYNLKVTKTTATAYELEIYDIVDRVKTQQTKEIASGDVSILLPNTTVNAKLNNTARLTTDFQIGDDVAEWEVLLRANPTPAIVGVMPALEFLGAPVLLELFGAAPVEPYLTFQNVWSDHPLPTYKLSGIVLAFIYRLHELRSQSHA